MLNHLTLSQVIYRQDAVLRTPEWFFDTQLGRYRDRLTGRFLSQRDALQLTQNSITKASVVLDQLTIDLSQGVLRLDQWQRQAAQVIKEVHIAQYILGRGGAKNVFPADYLEIARILKEEYRYLDQFAKDISSNQLSLAQVKARIRLYLNKSTVSYWAGHKRSQEIGPQPREMRRLLAPVEHCQECVTYAGAGWVPIGTLPLPTVNCSCRSNCKCRVEYR